MGALYRHSSLIIVNTRPDFPSPERPTHDIPRLPLRVFFGAGDGI
ncbi:protein of unknown function [Candidatus Nitrospira inopinata]|uniref:Uncharacterized protein n=1 Tax=Candidatus Nitrospira inopinata TaxID=1715989 RepID=A0A0S4KQH1_9BACT|nr:protein of unknown function [Candidatus Nitrospira inopinata]